MSGTLDLCEARLQIQIGAAPLSAMEPLMLNGESDGSGAETNGAGPSDLADGFAA